MNIILGAGGQVGGALAEYLAKQGAPVRGIIRDPEEAHALAEKGAQVGIADYTEVASLETAFAGGTAIFIITPESIKSNDVIGDAQIMLESYRTAIGKAGIRKIVGLSSMGAQYEDGSGNLQMSHLLETAFDGFDSERTFLRPAYFFSNWLSQLEAVREKGVLQGFFPVDFKIPMVSPLDVAAFAGEVLLGRQQAGSVYELEGPERLSTTDVANLLSELLQRQVEAQQIPENKWGESLENLGFSIDATRNFIEMTRFIIDGKAMPESNSIKLRTSLQGYLQHLVRLGG